MSWPLYSEKLRQRRDGTLEEPRGFGDRGERRHRGRRLPAPCPAGHEGKDHMTSAMAKNWILSVHTTGSLCQLNLLVGKGFDQIFPLYITGRGSITAGVPLYQPSIRRQEIRIKTLQTDICDWHRSPVMNLLNSEYIGHFEDWTWQIEDRFHYGSRVGCEIFTWRSSDAHAGSTRSRSWPRSSRASSLTRYSTLIGTYRVNEYYTGCLTVGTPFEPACISGQSWCIMKSFHLVNKWCGWLNLVYNMT